MDNLFLQFVVVILPSLLYEVVWKNKEIINTPGRHKLMVFFSCLISGVLCMLFPMHFLFPVTIVCVPLILGTLYGGYCVGIFLEISFVICQLLLRGASNFAIASLLHLAPFICSMTLYLFFHKLSKSKKLVFSLALIVLDSLNTSAIFEVKGYSILDLTKMFFITTLIGGFTIGFMNLLIESIQDQQLMKKQWSEEIQYKTIGELAASIAHDIRNPLTAARGFTQLLQHDIQTQREQNHIRVILDEIDRALHISTQYMALARPYAEDTALVDVAAIIESIAGVLTPYALLHDVELAHYVEAGIYVNGNYRKLEQVFLNVMKNGIESMPNGGLLQVKSVQGKRDKSTTIVFEDQGIGMDTEQLSKIGNPFYSTKASGTGLGLTMSYRIIHALGGNIQITSSKGVGTKVEITLPRHSIDNSIPFEDYLNYNH